LGRHETAGDVTANDLSLVTEAIYGLAEACPVVDTSLLTERQVLVLYLRFVKGLDSAETATALGCSVRAVQAIQARAMKRLREVW